MGKYSEMTNKVNSLHEEVQRYIQHVNNAVLDFNSIGSLIKDPNVRKSADNIINNMIQTSRGVSNRYLRLEDDIRKYIQDSILNVEEAFAQIDSLDNIIDSCIASFDAK